MFKKSVIILIILLSFNTVTNADLLNPADWGETEQDERLEDNADDMDSIKSLTNDYNNVDNLTIPGDTEEDPSRPATDSEKAAEIIRIENELNDLGDNISDRQADYDSNVAVLKENENDVTEAEAAITKTTKSLNDIQEELNNQLNCFDCTDYDRVEVLREKLIETQEVLNEEGEALYDAERKKQSDIEAIANGEVLKTQAAINKEIDDEIKKTSSELSQASTEASNASDAAEVACMDGNSAECREAVAVMNEADRKAAIAANSAATASVAQACMDGYSDECEAAIATMNETEAGVTTANKQAASSAALANSAVAEEQNNPGLKLIKKGDESVMYALLNQTDENNIIKVNAGEEGGLTTLGGVLKWIKDTLTGFVLLIAVGVFLYIGARLGFARGNPEEFKKAMMHFIYAVVGIFVISVSWALVTLIAGLNI